jgi:hypothetical protein
MYFNGNMAAVEVIFVIRVRLDICKMTIPAMSSRVCFDNFPFFNRGLVVLNVFINAYVIFFFCEVISGNSKRDVISQSNAFVMYNTIVTNH